MRKIYLVLSILLILCVNSHASVHRIVDELKLFNAFEDSLPSLGVEHYITEKLASLEHNQSVGIFDAGRGIRYAASFKDLPGIRLFVYDKVNEYNEGFYCILFNSCDSTIYPFGSGGEQFSQVIKKYLTYIINSNKICELLDLYVNTLTINVPYYDISLFKNYQEIWEEDLKWLGDQPTGIDSIRAEIEKDMQGLKNILGGMTILENTNERGIYYLITYTSWNKVSGDVEEWIIRLSESVFEIYKHRVLFLKKGPCLRCPN